MASRNANRWLLLAPALLLAAVAFAACGTRHTRSGGFPTAEGSRDGGLQSTDSVLAELDALACPEGVDSALWAELKAALEAAFLSKEESRFSNRDSLSTESRLESRDSGVGKFVSTPPAGETNRVNDLSIADNGDGTYTLNWHYRNLGDYGQDGVVGISDITPLAQHFGEEVPEDDTARNSLQAVIDGSGNGKVGIEDVTPIAQCFLREVARYVIEGAESADNPWSAVGEVAQDAGTGEGRLVYTSVISSPAALWHRVVAYDAEGNPGEPSNAVLRPSNEPIVYEVIPTEGYQHEECTFSATVTGAEALTYAWDFGSGAEPNTSSDVSPTVILADAGEYEAVLTVTNSYGSADYPFTLTVFERDMWIHTWGGPASEQAVDVAVDSEANVYVLGYTESFGAGGQDTLVLKYAPNGELQWARTWGGAGFEFPAGIGALGDGTIVVSGHTASFGAGMDDIFTLKYRSDGELLMQRTWGTPDYERVNDMAVDRDGHIYLTGYSTAYGGQADVLTLKLDNDGHVLWASVWDTGVEERGYCVAVSEGCAYVLPSVETGAENVDIVLVKYSGDGTVEWVVAWGGSGDEYISGIASAQNGTIYMSGYTTSFGEGESDLLLLSVLPDGSLSNMLTWGTLSAEGGGTLVCDRSGGIWLQGAKESDGGWCGLLLHVDGDWTVDLAVSAQRDWDLLSSLTLDGSANLYMVGGASNSSVAWEEVTGVTSEPEGVQHDLTAWNDAPLEGIENDTDGTESAPIGIEDTGGGGGSDVLAMKNIPR